MAKESLKSVELFAGAGGLGLGTAAAGIHPVLVAEWDRNACETIRLNRETGLLGSQGWTLHDGDVRDCDFLPYRDRADIVTGGPPCQPFSLGGKHRAQSDHRNMFPEVVRAVREIRPKAFIVENVKGLLRRNFSNYYNYIIKSLSFPTVRRKGDEEWPDHLDRLEKLYTSGKFGGLRYNVVFKLLNSANYGVPQRRERVFIVGVRSDIGCEFSYPHETFTEERLVYDKWVSGEYWERHRISKRARPEPTLREKRLADRLSPMHPVMLQRPWRTVRDAIGDLPRIAEGQTCDVFPNHYLNPGARSYPGHDGSPFDLPAKTLKAGDHGVPGGENTLRFEDGNVRYFSVRECARIQTFPDSWIFSGSWTETMRQLGNAVPVCLAETVASRLVATLAKTRATSRSGS